jgi:hypothetical protein
VLGGENHWQVMENLNQPAAAGHRFDEKRSEKIQPINPVFDLI